MRELGNARRFFGLSSGQQQRGHRGGLAHAQRHYVILHVLHGVINRHARRDRTSRRIDIELNVFLGIFLSQKQHLGNHQIGDVVVDRRAYEDDVIAKQPGIDVVGAFAPPGLLDDHRYQHHLRIIWFHGYQACPPATLRPEPTPALLGEGRKWSARLFYLRLRGLVIKKVEGLLTADSNPDSIEAAILCQTSSNRFRGLF